MKYLAILILLSVAISCSGQRLIVNHFPIKKVIVQGHPIAPVTDTLSFTTTSVPLRKELNGQACLAVSFYGTAINYPNFNTVWGDSLKGLTNSIMWVSGDQDQITHNVLDTSVFGAHDAIINPAHNYNCFPELPPDAQLYEGCVVSACNSAFCPSTPDFNNMMYRLWRQKLKPAHVTSVAVANIHNEYSLDRQTWRINQLGSNLFQLGNEELLGDTPIFSYQYVKTWVNAMNPIINYVRPLEPSTMRWGLANTNLGRILASTKLRSQWDSCANYWKRGLIGGTVPLVAAQTDARAYFYTGEDGYTGAGTLTRFDTASNWIRMWNQIDSGYNYFEHQIYDTLKAGMPGVKLMVKQWFNKKNQTGTGGWFINVYGNNWTCATGIEQQMAWLDYDRTNNNFVDCAYYEDPKDFMQPAGTSSLNYYYMFKLLHDYYLNGSSLNAVSSLSSSFVTDQPPAKNSTACYLQSSSIASNVIQVMFVNHDNHSKTIPTPFAVNGITVTPQFNTLNCYHAAWNSQTLIHTVQTNPASIIIPPNSWGYFVFTTP